jgi:hypothetical protein
MNKVFNSVLVLIILIFGCVIVHRHVRAKRSVCGSGNIGTFQIETIPVSSREDPLSKVKEICYFETQKDVDNWVCDGASALLSRDHVSQGKYSMELTWTADTSYRIFYYHFPKDWQNYDYFVFDVYNTITEPTAVTFEVYANFEEGSYGHPEGRFLKKRYDLIYGWNTIRTDIRKQTHSTPYAATGNKLIHMYFSDLNAVYYIDNMRLER